jgi:hypothetical protein
MCRASRLNTGVPTSRKRVPKNMPLGLLLNLRTQIISTWLPPLLEVALISQLLPGNA